MKRAILAAVLIATISAAAYPRTYVSRLHHLVGSKADTNGGLNCAAYISNAHGDGYIGAPEMWQGANGKLDILADLSGRAEIDESTLQPGDVADFHGDHVVAYLGSGVWADADYRRGNVAQFRMNDKPDSDPWFSGRVRILRWTR